MIRDTARSIPRRNILRASAPVTKIALTLDSTMPNRSPVLKLFMAVAILAFVTPSVTLGQAYKDAVGYNDLLAEKGGALEDGSGLRVLQPEAPVGGNYMPNVSDSQFTGKTIVNGTPGGSTGSSGHATNVGRSFYGNTNSMTPGITEITGYDANDYLGRVLNFNTGGDPLAQNFDVGNHSYIATGLTDADQTNLLQRFDYVINRDNTLMFVGANNGSGNSQPDLMAPSYNAVTVGRTDGNHSRGATSGYGTPRIKPDIVAPAATTSGATPIVASAGALLRDAGSGSNAAENEVVKALLFAGATKEEFPDWDRTVSRPIDDVFGFGELNILNSYHILEGGEFDGSTSAPSSNSGLFGWDFANFNGTDDLFYDFEITDGLMAAELSAALVWNIEVIDNNPDANVFDASTSLANLDLELFDSTGSFLGSLVDSSLSTDYNLEHIYLTDLAAGTYTFRISGDAAADFGFAWRITTIPEPAGSVVLLIGALALIRRRPARQRRTC